MTKKDNKQDNDKPECLALRWAGDIPRDISEKERDALIQQIVKDKIEGEKRRAAEWDEMSEEEKERELADISDNAPAYAEAVEEFAERYKRNKRRWALKPDGG